MGRDGHLWWRCQYKNDERGYRSWKSLLPRLVIGHCLNVLCLSSSRRRFSCWQLVQVCGICSLYDLPRRWWRKLVGIQPLQLPWLRNLQSLWSRLDKEPSKDLCWMELRDLWLLHLRLVSANVCPLRDSLVVEYLCQQVPRVWQPLLTD